MKKVPSQKTSLPVIDCWVAQIMKKSSSGYFSVKLNWHLNFSPGGCFCFSMHFNVNIDHSIYVVTTKTFTNNRGFQMVQILYSIPRRPRRPRAHDRLPPLGFRELAVIGQSPSGSNRQEQVRLQHTSHRKSILTLWILAS